MALLRMGRSLLPQRLEEAGKTQAQLARYLGISQPTISKYANNTKNMPFETAVNVATFLGCDPRDLYDWVPIKTL